MIESFQDASLVVLGHGTTLNEDSATPVRQHAAELRRRGLFAEVRAAFWKQEPQVKTVLAELKSQRLFIVPLFISEGYFSEEVIPRELGFKLTADSASRIMQHASRTTFFCRPVGTHEYMNMVILARVREVMERFPFPREPKPSDITLFIAGHGTERNESSRQSVERQVELMRRIRLFAGVHAVFLEEAPRIAEVYSLAQTRNVVVVPFFISNGLHTMQDIPVLLGESENIVKQRLAAGQPTWRNPTEKHGRLVWYSPAVGTEPVMASVILERVREAASAVGDDVRNP